MHYTSDTLHIRPSCKEEYIQVTPQKAGWTYLHFSARTLRKGERWHHQTKENEMGLVILGGICTVEANGRKWERVGGRSHVFEGLPYAFYFSKDSNLTLEALTDLDVAYGWCPTEEEHPSKLITTKDIAIELRGGENASRQINAIIPPGFPCQRLVCVEVYTPSGNWSSYPPHKHDTHIEEHGEIREAKLEEIYFYKITPPDGYALQQIYTDDHTIDALLRAQNNSLVLVPRGYHPVVSAHGYTTYYLNFLAGSAQSLANSDDPTYQWVKSGWKTLDSRVPVVR